MDQRIIGIIIGTVGAIAAASTMFFLVSGEATHTPEEVPITALDEPRETHPIERATQRLKQVRMPSGGLDPSPLRRKGSTLIDRPLVGASVMIHGHQPESVDRAFLVALQDVFACHATHNSMHNEELESVTLRFTLKAEGEQNWRPPTNLSIIEGTEHPEFLAQCIEGSVTEVRLKPPEGEDLVIEYVLDFGTSL